MRFSKWLESHDTINFAGFLKDGRVIVYINNKRYVYITDAIHHDKWQKMLPYAPWKVLNDIKANLLDNKG
jgi:hypothetical protein